MWEGLCVQLGFVMVGRIGHSPPRLRFPESRPSITHSGGLLLASNRQGHPFVWESSWGTRVVGLEGR